MYLPLMVVVYAVVRREYVLLLKGLVTCRALRFTLQNLVTHYICSSVQFCQNYGTERFESVSLLYFQATFFALEMIYSRPLIV